MVEKEVLIEDKGAFFVFLEMEFTDREKKFETTTAFTDHLFKIFQQTFWNHLRPVMFGVDANRTYKVQKDYLTKIVKPIHVDVEAAFWRVDYITIILLFLPPTARRERIATPKKWDSHQENFGPHMGREGN